MVQVSSLLAVTVALSASVVYAFPFPSSTGTKAVYFQTNKSPNSIVAVNIESGGKIGRATFHATGGVGNAELTLTGPHLPDSLGSQNSVVVYDDYLFNVDAGSDQISLFFIPPQDPTGLIRVGTYNVNGDFPNTVAVRDDVVCVAYAGTRSGVSCASWGPRGIGKFDSLRGFELHQQSPPNTTLSLVSDAFFADNDSLLVVTVRGSSSLPAFVATYPLDRNGQVSTKGNLGVPEGITNSFGAAAVPESSLILVSDPTFGAYTLDLNHPQAPASTINVPGQKAICWAGVTPKSAVGILPDAGTNIITQVNVHSGQVTQQWRSTNGNSGNFDFALSADNKLFALSFNPSDTDVHIASINLSGKFADIDNVAIPGADNHSQGLAIYPSA